jgi:hypothetical protein
LKPGSYTPITEYTLIPKPDTINSFDVSFWLLDKWEKKRHFLIIAVFNKVNICNTIWESNGGNVTDIKFHKTICNKQILCLGNLRT